MESAFSGQRPLARARFARSLRVLSGLRGWQRLVNQLVPEHSAAFTVRNGDTKFCGDLRSFVDRQVYLFGGYDSAQIRCFLSHVRAGRRGTILDIGANVGTHSLAFSRVFEAVEAFEPNPMLWSSFEKNMVLNELSSVHLHKVGLADRDSEMTLHLIDRPNFGLGTFSTIEQYAYPLRPSATCSIRHGDQYLSKLGIGKVDAVKIDVQGFEPEVLRGLTETLARDRPLIWCEIGAGTLAKMATHGHLTDLVPFDFQCFEMTSRSRWSRGSVELRQRAGDLPPGDYVLVPRDQREAIAEGGASRT